MEMADDFIITGGYEPSVPSYALTSVARYSVTGFIEYLAPLPEGRYAHACGSYSNSQGDTVRLSSSASLTLYSTVQYCPRLYLLHCTVQYSTCSGAAGDGWAEEDRI